MSMAKIQAALKAPKGQFNSFGKYNYRSCEDIVEAAKPILAQYGYHLVLSDRVVAVGNRVYVEATATVRNGQEVIETATGWAREAETKKGMDESQITGSSSSYSRKYALNGLFAIDDTKDADHADNRSGASVSTVQQPATTTPVTEWLSRIYDCSSLGELQNVFTQAYKENSDNQSHIDMLVTAKDNKKGEFA